ncbi:MAG TPA: amidohydrolase [Lapillicoccus sp.]|nr:amidohydrolase [Lapillicoccus sp.]
MDPLLPVLHATVDELESELVGLRRDLHAHPELARLETRTSRVVADRLALAGLQPTLLDGSGVVVDIGAEQPAYRVALRADLDALPVADRTGLDWASVTEGVAHACGHDLHTSLVLGAGLALATQAPALSSAGLGVRLIFQPAEEVIPGGAHEIIDGGWLTGVDEVFALHSDPSRDVGEVGLLVGPITAASDGIEVTLKGHGGHTSRPHLTQDLTFALAKVVTEVPAALSRRMDPRAGAALVWGSVHAGGAQNVIPSVGTASGTLRILDADLWREVGALVEELVEAVVAPYAVTAEVRYTQGVPPVVNAGPSVDSLRDAAHAAGVAPGTTVQSLGGEDFAWYLTEVRGAMGRIGTRTPGGPTYDLHQGDLVVDERALAFGAKVLVGAVLDAGRRHAQALLDVPSR